MQDYLTYSTSSKAPVAACAISSCGSYLAFNSDVQTLQIVSLKSIRSPKLRKDETNLNDSLTVLFDYKMGSQIRCLDFGRGDVSNNRLPHRSNKRRITYPVMNNACLLAVGLKSGQVKIYSLWPSTHFDGSQQFVENGGNAKLVLHNHYEDMATVSFSLDGSLRLASISIDGKLCLWDMWDDGNMYKTLSMPNSFRPSCCAWGNKSKQVCVGGAIGKCHIYQSEKPCVKVATLAQVHHNDISACKYTSDDSLLGTSSFDTSVVIWCAGTYKPLLQIWQSGSKPSMILMGGAHTKYLRDFSFSPDCLHLVTLSDDDFIRMWNLEDTTSTVDQLCVPHTGRKLILSCVKFTPDGSKFVVCTSEGNILFFNSKSPTESLANLCRKSVREKLVLNLHNLVNNAFVENSELNKLKPLSLLEMEIPTNRRRSTSDIFFAMDHRQSLNLNNVVSKLPIPGMLKSYLQYGLIGSELVENVDHRPIRPRPHGGRNMSIY